MIRIITGSYLWRGIVSETLTMRLTGNADADRPTSKPSHAYNFHRLQITNNIDNIKRHPHTHTHTHRSEISVLSLHFTACALLHDNIYSLNNIKYFSALEWMGIYFSSPFGACNYVLQCTCTGQIFCYGSHSPCASAPPPENTQCKIHFRVVENDTIISPIWSEQKQLWRLLSWASNIFRSDSYLLALASSLSGFPSHSLFQSACVCVEKPW